MSDKNFFVGGFLGGTQKYWIPICKATQNLLQCLSFVLG